VKIIAAAVTLLAGSEDRCPAAAVLRKPLETFNRPPAKPENHGQIALY